MLDSRELQRVPASRERAERLLSQAQTHLRTAADSCDADPSAAYAVMYDAARKALVAVLENQGIRPTSRGGHLAAYEAARAQLDPPLGRILRPFDRMRRRRNNAEYPSDDIPDITAEEVRESLPKATEIVTAARRLVEEMPVL
jgi:uncharacterized protein (UPF0332 family)